MNIQRHLFAASLALAGLAPVSGCKVETASAPNPTVAPQSEPDEPANHVAADKAAAAPADKAAAAPADKAAAAPADKAAAAPADKAAAAPSDTPLKAGDPAPDVTFALADGTSLKLASLHGTRVLVYFYPKDDAPGCTIEAKGIRDHWDELKAAGLKVIGVSMQDADAHKAFTDKYDLPFPLATDGAALAKAFHVPLRFGLAARQSFLVGKDGKIERAWHDVDPSTHAAEVLAAVK